MFHFHPFQNHNSTALWKAVLVLTFLLLLGLGWLWIEKTSSGVSQKAPSGVPQKTPSEATLKTPSGASQKTPPKPISTAETDPPMIWFVHGMITLRESFHLELEELKRTFPNAETVTLKAWASPKLPSYQMGKAWGISLAEAEKYVSQLATEIEQLPEIQRRRLVLVGHSLGGRIAVKALAACDEKGITIRQLILAGAAINNDDPLIAQAIHASTEKVLNLINPIDALLALYQVAGEQHAALGTGYLFSPPTDRFCEITMNNTVEHYGYRYFEKLRDCQEKNDFSNQNIIVPQDYTNVDTPTMGGYFWWTTLDEKSGWRLQQHVISGLCRILDPNGIRQAWGRLVILQTAFEKVKIQLDSQPTPSE